MEQIRPGLLIIVPLLFVCIIGNVLCIQKRDWKDNPPTKLSEGDVECFSEYMEVWIHSVRIEGLRQWLSGVLQIQVSLASLDHLNLQLSACGFSLHNDPDKNYIFRVMYTGCFVRQQHGNNVLLLNLVKRIHRFGGRGQSFIIKCPVVSVLPNREHIQCDPEYIQVTREIPHDSWNKELDWSLSLRGNLIVALEDASLIQVNIDMTGPDIITVQGRRREILSPVIVMENAGEFLALKLVSGQYAYSMEATCPNRTESTAQTTVLHIFKRRMGLTKRGGYESDTLTVSSVSVNQTDTFTVHETSYFVQLIIPTALILQTKTCTDNTQLQQPFYRVDVVLTFKETNHKMHWTMENTLPCTDGHTSTAAKSPVPYTTSTPGSYTTAPAPPIPTPTLDYLTTDQPVEQPSSIHATKSTDETPPEETSTDWSTSSLQHTETEATGSDFYRSLVTTLSPIEFASGATATSETKAVDFHNIQDPFTESGSTQLEFRGSSERTEPSDASYHAMVTGEHETATGQAAFHGTTTTTEKAQEGI